MLASIFPWILYLLAWVCTLMAVENAEPFWPTLLLYTVIFNGGIQGLWSALGHLCFPKETAKKIGWSSNAFQSEVGATDLALGIAGSLCFVYRSWSIPVGLILGIFYLGCVGVHIRDRYKNKNTAPCNSGPMLYNTLVVAITIFLSLSMLQHDLTVILL